MEKDERLVIRISKKEKESLVNNLKKLGLTPSKFLRIYISKINEMFDSNTFQYIWAESLEYIDTKNFEDYENFISIALENITWVYSRAMDLKKYTSRMNNKEIPYENDDDFIKDIMNQIKYCMKLSSMR